jgi:lipopolysaccharide/colanic/teichoic acid biosynthesis glycosyltransferase
VSLSDPQADLVTRVDIPGKNAFPRDSNGWMRGFHGAIVDFSVERSVPLSQLAMSRRSVGLGRIRTLIELPDAPGERVPPQASVGARHVTRSGAASAVDGYGAVSPMSARGGTPSAAVGVIPAQRRGSADDGVAGVGVRPGGGEAEPLPAFLDRQLADARYVLLPNRSRAYAATKRILDFVVASVLLVIFAPVMLALAVLIRLDSPGPAIFRQERVTRGGRLFRFYKFRTMYVDARERYPELYDYRLDRNEFESAYYKLSDDPRNTRVGRWLRRTTLDELPNLFNVIRGDLSLVGPRPDLPEFVRLYRPEELCCLFTKAGLTGVAQVAGRSLLTVRERLTLDMRYVAHQTVLLDLRILWRTVVVVLSGRGAF